MPSLEKVSPALSALVSASSDNLKNARFRRAGHERAGQHDAMLRMAGAGIGFRAGELFLAQIDLRLIPELDPFVVERLVEVEAGGDRRRHAELELLEDLDDRVGLEWLLEHRQHVELVLDADVLDVIEHRGAAIAHQLHGAAKAVLAERDHRLDRVGGFERDVVEHEGGHAAFRSPAQRRAVGKFHGVDAGAVQHQRQKVPDAGFLVDHIAERGAARRQRRRLDDGGAVGGLGRRWGGRLGHEFELFGGGWKHGVRRRYWCAKLVNYGFPWARRTRPRAPAKSTEKHEEFGDPGWIRTSDPQLRRLVLYPAELRGRRATGLPAPRRHGKVRADLCAANVGGPRPAMSAIADLTCAELALGYRRGELSPVEVARDVLARIERHAAFNAFLPIEPEAVLAAASAIGSALAGGARRSARSTACRPRSRTISGPRACPPGAAPKPAMQRRRRADSPAVARLREQGAVILGKTSMPEHGWIGVCHSPLTGITRNPWNPEHTPGGSTGGGAVAALLGLGVLHLGTDGAGSLRIPAAFTGVFGMKPSFGRVPIYPALLLNVLSHQGPITRTVADAALMLSVIAQPGRARHGGLEYAGAGFHRRPGRRRARPCASRSRRGSVMSRRSIRRSRRRRARRRARWKSRAPSSRRPIRRSARALDLIRAMWWPVAAAIVDAVPEARRAEMDPGLLAIAERGRSVHGRRLSGRLYRARRAAQRHAGLPRALRPAADADHAGHRAQSRARHAGRPAISATTGSTGRPTPIRST